MKKNHSNRKKRKERREKTIPTHLYLLFGSNLDMQSFRCRCFLLDLLLLCFRALLPAFLFLFSATGSCADENCIHSGVGLPVPAETPRRVATALLRQLPPTPAYTSLSRKPVPLALDPAPSLFVQIAGLCSFNHRTKFSFFPFSVVEERKPEINSEQLSVKKKLDAA